MKLFLYEYAKALPGLQVPDSIRREGLAMFHAIAQDAVQLQAVDLLTLESQSSLTEKQGFIRYAEQADWSLVIAPETDGVLLERCRWVEEAGGKLLGPSLDAIRLTGDKWETYKQWRQHAVPTPETWLQFPHQRAMRKLQDGAGSDGIFLCQSSELEHSIDRTRKWIWQEFVPGQAASVSFFFGRERKAFALLPGAQHLSQDGYFRYEGGSFPLPQPLADRTLRITQKAVEAIPVLFGYVGVDLVLGDAADGSQDYAIEINPRFTTSYIGLRAMSEVNLLGILLDMAEGKKTQPLVWKNGLVTFDPTGKVDFQSL